MNGLPETEIETETGKWLDRPVVLVGMMASGKSRLGRMLAAALGVEFYDSDSLIEARAGMDIPTIFATAGEGQFRDYEHEILNGLLQDDCGGRVIATGGGAVIRPENAALIFGPHTITIWLRAQAPTLLKRVKGGKGRPLLQNAADPRAVLDDLLRVRTPLYARADIAVDTDHMTPNTVCDHLVAEIKKRMI